MHSEYGVWIRRLLKDKAPVRLSSAALETLAIIVFKQPVMKAEVEHIRGVSVDGVVRAPAREGIDPHRRSFGRPRASAALRYDTGLFEALRIEDAVGSAEDPGVG